MALTDRQIRQANQVGVLIDGLGLRLKISATGNGALSKRWALRYTSPDGRRRETGLGGFPEVSLSEARKRAAGLRQDVRAGIDPLAARTNAREARIIEAARSLSFADCAARYITAHEVSWRNPKHRQQWSSTCRAKPAFHPDRRRTDGSKPAKHPNRQTTASHLSWGPKPDSLTRAGPRLPQNIRHHPRLPDVHTCLTGADGAQKGTGGATAPTAIIEPGGLARDQESAAAFTGIHFILKRL
jgi:hypothetical protein